MPVDQMPPPGGGPGPQDNVVPDPHESQLADLSLLVLGRLPAGEAATVRDHLFECPICLAELPLLEQTEQMLAAVEAEAFLDGPPEGAELLVRRTVRAIRARDGGPSVELSRDRGARRAAPPAAGRMPSPRLVLAAAAAIVLAVAVGVIGGRLSAPASTVAGPSPAGTATPKPGTMVATSTDSTTGARLSVTVVPAAGWVRITAAASGIAKGEKCRLFVIDRAGTRTEAGSWLVSATGAAKGTTVQGSAIVDPAQVAAVQVQNTAGKVLVTTPI
jgi:Putative zinc-finger